SRATAARCSTSSCRSDRAGGGLRAPAQRVERRQAVEDVFDTAADLPDPHHVVDPPLQERPGVPKALRAVLEPEQERAAPDGGKQAALAVVAESSPHVACGRPHGVDRAPEIPTRPYRVAR